MELLETQKRSLSLPFFTALCIVQCLTCGSRIIDWMPVNGVNNGSEWNISFINVTSDEGILQAVTQHIQQVLPCYHKILFCPQILFV